MLDLDVLMFFSLKISIAFGFLLFFAQFEDFRFMASPSSSSALLPTAKFSFESDIVLLRVWTQEPTSESPVKFHNRGTQDRWNTCAQMLVTKHPDLFVTLSFFVFLCMVSLFFCDFFFGLFRVSLDTCCIFHWRVSSTSFDEEQMKI
jgi:hypothetical protein